MYDFYKQLNLIPNSFKEVPPHGKNLACIVAISDEYVEYALKSIDRLSNWDVCVLTDQPERFQGLFRVDKYENAIFSLVDKILYPIRISMELQRGSMLIDADDLSLLTEDFINSNHSYEDFVCISTWTIDSVALSREWGQTISKHIDMLGLKEGEFIKPPLEKVLYFPYIKELNEIRYLVELVKPSLDHSSIWSIGKWKTLGQGEGAALGIALRKLNIDLSFFEKDPFVPRKRMPAI